MEGAQNSPYDKGDKGKSKPPTVLVWQTEPTEDYRNDWEDHLPEVDEDDTTVFLVTRTPAKKTHTDAPADAVGVSEGRPGRKPRKTTKKPKQDTAETSSTSEPSA